MGKIENSLVTLPDGVNVPTKIWLLMLDAGNLRQVRPFFDEQQAKDVVREAHNIALAAGNPDIATVLGPYKLRNDV
jgi:hypothetical protein